jgi:hypothetical protein
MPGRTEHNEENHMSGTIMSTFRYGPLMGWSLNISYRWDETPEMAGELAYATATLEGPLGSRGIPVVGGMATAPRIEGYDLVRDLLVNGGGGHDRQMRVAEWLIESMREAVEHGVALPMLTLPDATAAIWRALVEQADDAHAHWFGRFGDLDPDTAVRVETHPFQALNGTPIFNMLAAAR